jgi:hypothetical protein
MRRALGICLALLGLFTPAIGGQVSRIGVDRRVELMAIIFKLAGNGEFNQNNYLTYNADIERHFGPFRDHAAVVLARELREQYGVGFASVMSIAIRLSDPPELRALVPFDSAGGWPAPAAAMERFVAAARRFALDSRAAAFFDEHRAMYDSADARLRRPVARDADFAWIAGFYGVPPDRDFVVVPLLASSQVNFGPCDQPPGARLECYSILGHRHTDSAGFPIFDEDFVPTLVHEVAHGFANPLANARRAEFERSGPRVYALVADAMHAQAYPWTSMINESLVRATEARYHAAHQGEEAMRAFLAEQRRSSWFWLDELANLFARYESDRSTYPTLAAFMPQVIAYFDSLPDRVPDMQRRYDALRPKIVALSIENGSETVDPSLTEIVVRFDRPVREDGWTVVPVFGSSRGPSPDSQARARVPTIKWKSLGGSRVAFVRGQGQGLDSAGTTFRLGVELEPGREYEFMLNTPHGFGLRNAYDGVPLAPYRIRFKTRTVLQAKGAP